jgi:hypothetical protein
MCGEDSLSSTNCLRLVSLNTVAHYRQELGLKAVLVVKQVNTTIPIKAHKKYSYKLRGFGINHANQVWSTDITKASLSTLITNCESIVLDILCDNTAFECQSMIAAI